MEELLRERPQAVLARLELKDENKRGILFDATGEKAFNIALFNTIARRRSHKGLNGEFQGHTTRRFRHLRGSADAPLEPAAARGAKPHLIVFGDRLILKLFRRMKPGINPDLEMCQHLPKRPVQERPRGGRLD